MWGFDLKKTVREIEQAELSRLRIKPSDNLREPLGERISFPDRYFKGGGLDSPWAQIRSKEIISALQRHTTEVMWEFGAGSGRVSLPIREAGIAVICVEPLEDNIRQLEQVGLPTVRGEISSSLVAQGSIGHVGVFDVLEHIEDDVSALRDIHTMLARDGRLFITVPAHNWLFSSRDSALGHFRRYSMSSLKRSLASSGFEVVEARYLFSFLVPVALLTRKIPEMLRLRSSTPKASVDEYAQTKFLNKLGWLFRFSHKIESGLKIPFGLSIIAVAKPKSSNH